MGQIGSDTYIDLVEVARPNMQTTMASALKMGTYDIIQMDLVTLPPRLAFRFFQGRDTPDLEWIVKVPSPRCRSESVKWRELRVHIPFVPASGVEMKEAMASPGVVKGSLSFDLLRITRLIIHSISLRLNMRQTIKRSPLDITN